MRFWSYEKLIGESHRQWGILIVVAFLYGMTLAFATITGRVTAALVLAGLLLVHTMNIVKLNITNLGTEMANKKFPKEKR